MCQQVRLILDMSLRRVDDVASVLLAPHIVYRQLFAEITGIAEGHTSTRNFFVGFWRKNATASVQQEGGDSFATESGMDPDAVDPQESAFEVLKSEEKMVDNSRIWVTFHSN